MKKTALIILLAGALPATAGETDSVLSALTTQRNGLWKLAAPVFNNVALDQWRMPLGITSVDAAVDHRADNRAVDPMAGKSSTLYSAGAETYTKYHATTLGGSARYTNGLRRDVRWCETSDPALLYPYLLADATGGDLKTESYSFSGSYACHGERLAWGASLAYRATLEYRDVDPRPRNVVGALDATASLAYNIMYDYWLGADFDFRRYTQSNDIEFKSEMGVDKIYHLTGPLHHYARFAGTGMSTHYQGYRYGIGAAAYPASGRGAFARVHASTFSFDNILSDLNKLPMARANHKAIEASIGWLQPSGPVYWGVTVSAEAYRRHGRENIFGDASSGIYPQIASVDMFAENYSYISASGQVGLRSRGNDISLRLTSASDYRSTLYVSPRSLSRVRHFLPEAELKYCRRFSQRWLALASISAAWEMPFDRLYQPAGAHDADLAGLAAIEAQRNLLLDHSSFYTGANVTIARMISRRLALKLDLAYSGSSYYSDITSNSLNVTFGLIF